jgi:uncharacterized protein YdhG (YjbR/CyaY superfamily)
MKSTALPGTVDIYIACFPLEIREKMNIMRAIIKKAAPGAEEKISYRMPSYTFNGMLVYFAGHTRHIGLYPMASAIAAFKDELKDYKTSRGTIQFPHDKPFPLDLIKKIISFRVMENRDKALMKQKR